MPPRTKNGSLELGSAIRERRIALDLSIEEAAAKAGIGTKSWSRYESGAAIRADKVRGICKALGWSRLPETEQDDQKSDDDFLRTVDRDHRAWSAVLEENFGRECAVTFAVGSDVVSNQIRDDLTELAKEPRGAHLGQLSTSWLDGDLPPQFVPRYDYELVYALKAAVSTLRARFSAGHLVAHTVLEELALYLILSQAEILDDLYPEFEGGADWREWLGDILDDLDVEFYLFTSGLALTPDHTYHFARWSEEQFYTGREQAEGE
ncbi:helix-turn-helix domain-containing protein [Nocardia cyriacigeorgica]|uniref:helix-turn-helix domain-containing protein n=1 Tax=Nocardia cyriacigeorgica TaxID=135487 RepID=UPI0018938C1F|nr:helix-turn-helix transcriptional regulator [Nocardia cyriacigeorgica]MBF6451878.1 helix-turn-helix transcriptional regulator [Nocardia cyriacigeorgica]MBF6478989.1 helix-turn-helix transcriptional regulator [Nocardia cyriacigeorgica]MBF6549047.1 helix-turn-helix transcriptional regulator [Nocardia cyriacigeorgica]